jgi:hypothetical protein
MARPGTAAAGRLGPPPFRATVAWVGERDIRDTSESS